MSLEDLHALETETKDADAVITATAMPDATGEPSAEETAAPVADYQTEAAQAVDMFAALIVGYAPGTADIWNDGTKGRVAAALAPVMAKYGVSFGSLPPELTLIVVAGPPLYMSARIVAAQMKSDRAPKANENDAPAAPDAAPDAGVHPQVQLYQ